MSLNLLLYIKRTIKIKDMQCPLQIVDVEGPRKIVDVEGPRKVPARFPLGPR